MNDKEAVDMMQRCVHELESQRALITRLQPNAEAYEVIRDVVRLIPKTSGGYGEDLVWRLRKKIEELQSKPSEGE